MSFIQLSHTQGRSEGGASGPPAPLTPPKKSIIYICLCKVSSFWHRIEKQGNSFPKRTVQTSHEINMQITNLPIEKV